MALVVSPQGRPAGPVDAAALKGPRRIPPVILDPQPRAEDRREIASLVSSGLSLHEAYESQTELAEALSRFTLAPSLTHLKYCGGRADRQWPRLPRDPTPEHPFRPARVVIATPDLVGPIRNGGIGTAYTGLARALAAAGHTVTLLYTLGRHCEQGTIEDWIDSYRREGITFVPCPPPSGPSHVIGSRDSLGVFEWLRGQAVDVVHFPEWTGVAAYSVQAKRLAIAFQATQLCIGVHSPSLWHDVEDGRPVDRIEQLERDALERRSVELADIVVSPSQYLLRWLDSSGWTLPSRAYVHPYVWPESASRRTPRSARPVRELVFFGRLEFRKGLALFCDAVDRIASSMLEAGVDVTFLGKPGWVRQEDGVAYARARAARWGLRWQAIPNYDRDAALEYLRSRDALAVIPSLADNTPNTVVECLASGIPFVSTTVGGIPELVHPSDHQRVLAAPEVPDLARLLEGSVRTQARPVRPADDPDDIRARWIAWHESQIAPPAPVRTTSPPSPQKASPLVSVCMATYDRPSLLSQALASIRRQTYSPIELILVDDGSETAEGRSYLAQIEPELKTRGWTLVRQTRAFPGAARNAAAIRARGRYLLFMDDDNVAYPDEIARLVDAAECSAAAIVTCGHDAFSGNEPPGPSTVATHRWMPIGPSLPLALLRNCVGDTNMLIRREAFFQAGRFDEERGAGLLEDWTLLIKALLRGLPIEVFPEALYWYRLGPQGFGQALEERDNQRRALRPLAGLLPSSLELAIHYAQGASRRAWSANLAGEQVDLQRMAQPGRRFRDLLHRKIVATLRPSGNAPRVTDLERRFDAGLPQDVFSHADVRRIVARHQATVSIAGEVIKIESSGDEPQVLLSRSHRVARGPLLLQVDLSSPVSTVLQVYWKSPRLPLYCEEQSARAAIVPGRQTTYIHIPGSVIIGRVRLDPAARTGTFLLHRLEIRREQLDPRASTLR